MIGEVLRIIRIANDLKIKDVALETGISAAFISEIENNKKRLSMSTLKKLAEYYNISVSYILVLQELKDSLDLIYQQILYFTLAYYLFDYKLENVTKENLSEKVKEVKELARINLQ